MDSHHLNYLQILMASRPISRWSFLSLLLTWPYLKILLCYLYTICIVFISFSYNSLMLPQFTPSSSHQDYCNSFLTILHRLSEFNFVSSSKTSDGSHSPQNNSQEPSLCMHIPALTDLWDFGEIIDFLRVSISFPHCVLLGTVAQVVYCMSVSSCWNKWKLESNPCFNCQISSLTCAESVSGQRRKHLSLICPKLARTGSFPDFFSNIYIVFALLVTQIQIFYFSQIRHVLEHPSAYASSSLQ